jgi:hypothetical protein
MNTPTMKTPPQVIIYRLITVTVAAAVLLMLGFGLADRGPLGSLGQHVRPVSPSIQQPGTGR